MELNMDKFEKNLKEDIRNRLKQDGEVDERRVNHIYKTIMALTSYYPYEEEEEDDEPYDDRFL